jgi:hypothetical protein
MALLESIPLDSVQFEEHLRRLSSVWIRVGFLIFRFFNFKDALDIPAGLPSLRGWAETEAWGAFCH